MKVYVPLNSWHPSHKKQKDGLETFHLNLKYLGWPYREYIKQQKMVPFVRNCFIMKMTLRLL